MNQTWENGETPKFGTDFGPFDQNLGRQNFFVGLTSFRC